MTVLEAALEYDGRGWCIIPIRAGTKKPAIKVWKPFQSQRPTTQDLHGWFGNGSHTALAVVLGPVSSDLVCRDFDQLESYETWSRSHLDLAATLPTVSTSRGRHVYFRADIEALRRHSPNDTGTIIFADGELRGADHYVLLPPSAHPDGATYRWLIPLPEGEIPMLDPVSAGFIPPLNGRHREDRVDRGKQRITEVIGSVLSVHSANSVRSVHSDNSVVSDNSVLSVANTEDFPEPVQRAILESLPEHVGQRNRMLLRLARRLKPFPASQTPP